MSNLENIKTTRKSFEISGSTFGERTVIIDFNMGAAESSLKIEDVPESVNNAPQDLSESQVNP